MKMRSVFMAVVPAVILVLGLCAPNLASAQSSNQLAGTICGATPDVAATDWQQLFPISKDPKQCAAFCQLWMRTCLTIVNITNSCYLAEFVQESVLIQAQCGNDRTCIANELANLKSERANELSLFATGRSSCLDGLQSCLSNCVP